MRTLHALFDCAFSASISILASPGNPLVRLLQVKARTKILDFLSLFMEETLAALEV